MDVYSSDNHKIGQVEGVCTTMIGGSGLDQGGTYDVDAGTTPNTYIKVHQHHLIGKDNTLYIPANQVLEIDDHDRVRVGMARFDAEERYAQAPTGIDE
jgi:hypothetical protein